MKLTKTESEFLEHMKSLRKNDWYLYLAIMCMMNATIKDRGDNSPIGRDVSAASSGDLKRAIKRLAGEFCSSLQLGFLPLIAHSSLTGGPLCSKICVTSYSATPGAVLVSLERSLALSVRQRRQVQFQSLSHF